LTDCGEGEFKVSTKAADKELEQLRQTVALTSKEVLRVTRDSYSILSLTLDVFGATLPFWIDLLAQGVFLAAETFSDLAAAEALSGWLIFKSALSFSLAAMLFYRGLMLMRSKTEIENKLNSTLQIVSILGRYR